MVTAIIASIAFLVGVLAGHMLGWRGGYAAGCRGMGAAMSPAPRRYPPAID